MSSTTTGLENLKKLSKGDTLEKMVNDSLYGLGENGRAVVLAARGLCIAQRLSKAGNKEQADLARNLFIKEYEMLEATQPDDPRALKAKTEFMQFANHCIVSMPPRPDLRTQRETWLQALRMWEKSIPVWENAWAAWTLILCLTAAAADPPTTSDCPSSQQPVASGSGSKASVVQEGHHSDASSRTNLPPQASPTVSSSTTAKAYSIHPPTETATRHLTSTTAQSTEGKRSVDSTKGKGKESSLTQSQSGRQQEYAVEQVASLRSEKRDLERQLRALRAENEALKAKVNPLYVEVRGLRADNKALKDEVDDMRIGIVALKGKMAGLQAENDYLKEHMNGLRPDDDTSHTALDVQVNSAAAVPFTRKHGLEGCASAEPVTKKPRQVVE